MNAPVVVALLAVGFVVGVVVRSQWKGRKVRFYPVPVPVVRIGSRRPAWSDAGPGIPAPSQRVPGLLGMEPTALYVPRDRAGGVLYAGISNDVDARFRQHADSKVWAGEVASVSVHVLPDRYMALAAEWALIHYLRPPHNTAPSGSCDAWTEQREPIVAVTARWPRVRSQARRLTRGSAA